MVIREAQSIHPYSDVSAFLLDKFNMEDYLNNHASEFAITTYEYCTTGEQLFVTFWLSVTPCRLVQRTKQNLGTSEHSTSCSCQCTAVHEKICAK